MSSVPLTKVFPLTSSFAVGDVTPKPKSFIYSGYTAYYVKGNIFGFSEDIDVEAIVYQSEYYAK